MNGATARAPDVASRWTCCKYVLVIRSCRTNKLRLDAKNGGAAVQVCGRTGTDRSRPLHSGNTQAAGASGHGKLTGRLATSVSFCVNASCNRAHSDRMSAGGESWTRFFICNRSLARS